MDMSAMLNRDGVKEATKAWKRFRKEEDGSVIVLTLFLLVLMLILGGMAVDFMRFESRRAMLQGVTDRAVLAAADLDQDLDPAAVVKDYFKKAGMENYLDGEPYVSPASTDYREVRANGRIDLDTYFLRLIGMDVLTATATSTAIEGVGNIEVSLILDVSGSMNETIPGSSPAERRIDRLRSSASNFVTTLLDPANADRVSLSLVPYSEHVNVGPEIFDELNMNQLHDYSYCVELPDTVYSSTSLSTTTLFEQAQHLQTNPAYDTDGDGLVNEFVSGSWSQQIDVMNQPVCPQQDFEQIVPISQNVATLTGNINQLHPRSGTSIFMGMKWGVFLLDPDFNSIYTALPSSMKDPAFANRPVEWNDETGTGVTKKYVVLMTDGQNDNSWRLHNEYYDTDNEIAHWARQNFQHYKNRPISFQNWYTWAYQKYTANQGDTNLAAICNAAKAPGRDVTIYAIAMGTDSDPTEDARGKAALQGCSSGPGFYYETSGAELDAIFQEIADQITDLRLTQ